MFNKIKNIVFGLNEYDKTKIDLRFVILNNIVKNLKIEKLEDFEILEEVIAKIKEQLRIKSSNLNKVIADPTKKLNKNDVMKLLLAFDKIKYEFLKTVFSNFDSKNENLIQPQLQNNLNVKEIQIEENANYKLILENAKVPILILVFKQEINYPLISKFSSMLFEFYNAHGTNLIIENNRVLIIPRIENDNLIEIQRTSMDIDKVYDKLISKPSETPQYAELNEKKPQYWQKKKKDESLDLLLQKTENKDLRPHPNPRIDNTPIEVIKSDPIEIEMKEKEIKEEEVQIEKIEKPQVSFNSKSNEVYRDDKIIAYFNENSKILGELIVESVNENPIKELNESDLSYMMLFSKVFSTVVFEIMQSHGTNMYFDYNDNKMIILPRFNNDEVGNFWTPKQESDGFLEQIKQKLVSKMHGDPKEQKTLEIKEEKPQNDDKKEKGKFILESLRRIP